MNTRDGYAELQSRILDARRVWKRSLFWTGIAIVLIGILAILVGESIIDVLMPLPSPVRIALLAGIVGAILYLLYKHLIQPLRAALTIRDVALNVEQNHPNLEDRLVSAVQFGDRESDDPIEAHMLQRLVEDTTQRIKDIDFKATVDHSRTRKYVGIATLVIAACGLFALLFPTETQTSLMRIFVPWEKTDPILTTKVQVSPGNARILRGKSLPIEVIVTGKDADKVVLTYYDEDTPPTAENEGSKQDINMLQNPEDKRGFAYEIFNIETDMEYYVVANETTSERYTVEVFEMPRLDEISVSYTYPEYTNLKPVVQQGSGDIKAVVGTTAEIRITTNKAIQKATFTLQNSEASPITEEENAEGSDPTKSIEMNIADGNVLSTTLNVREDGKYTVELFCIDEFKNEIPIEYNIKAMPDNPPEVVIKEPGRDVKATKLEEVKIVAVATDDYGVEKLNLMYRIGAGELKEIALESTGEPVPEDANVKSGKHLHSGTYTFYLEEFDVEPGEVISYYAHAVDNNTLSGPSEANSEIYFIEIKPFNQRLEQGDPSDAEAQAEAESMPNPVPELLATQKQIIRETWKHINSQPSTLTEEYKTAVKQTGKKQSDLKDNTQRVADELSMAMQEMQVDPEIMMNLEKAIDMMGKAKDNLNATQPLEAMPPEQAALELLNKVNLEIPKVLQRARSSQPQLAENFELEMEDLQSELEQDQEELEQEMQEQTQQMLDQAREMLEQQQNLNEQSQQMGREDQPSPSDMQQNSQQQGQLSQQAQQMSQQLSQMQGNAQSTQQQRLNQAGQAMQQAGEQMQQASQGMQQQQPQMSAAKGQKAEERIEEAIEQLERASAEFTDNALERTAQQLQQLTAEQSDVQQQTEELRNRSQQSGMSPEDYRQASELANEQRQLQRDLESLEENLSNLQDQLNQENPEAAENVSDASRRLAEEQTSEGMATAQRALQWRSMQSADLNQQEVIETLEQAQADLQQARANMANTEEEQIEAALEQLQNFEEQMQDIQRELQANEGQEQTEAQQQREQQLAEQQQQLRERMQQAQQAMQNAQEEQQPGQEGQQPGQEGQQPGQEGQQPGQEGQQPGQEGQGENENDLARGGAESNSEIKKLWLEMFDSMQPPSGNRSRRFANYELAIRDLRKLEDALEERLNMLQEKKQLTQVAKEDVPPEYRRLVDNYYESLAK